MTENTHTSLEDFKRLVNWAGHLHEEAEQCAGAGYWRAAFILSAATVEAGLAATVLCFEPELLSKGLLKPKEVIAKLSLARLVDVARKAGWLPFVLDGSEDESEALAGGVGDAIRFLIKLRNVAVHPMAYVRDLPWLDFGDPMISDWFSICEGIIDQVFKRLTSTMSSS